MIEFDFKRQCLFCANICEPVNPKHPDRWDRVVQWGSKVLFHSRKLYCNVVKIEMMPGAVKFRYADGVHDLAAAEAQYHYRCYDNFR